MAQHEVDFLPVQFRQHHARRRDLSQCVLLSAAVLGLLCAVAAWQAYSGRRARRELAEITPQYELAVRQGAELSKLQAELQVAQAEADLITYLDHPWPRSRLLTEVVDALPEAITLKDISIVRENGRSEVGAFMPQLDRRTQEQEMAKLPPAARDLKALRELYDRSRMVIRLTGTTSDDAAPHRFVAALGKGPLFAEADLVSLENGGSPRDGKLEFAATVAVRPGYGLPGGPSGPPPDAVAQKGGQP